MGEDLQAESKPRVQQVDEIDRLKLENVHLRLLLCAFKEKSLVDELHKARAERSELQQQIVVLNKQLVDKYGVDPATQEVSAETGQVLPRGQAGTGFGDLLRQIAQQRVQHTG
jgi:hypothetical protein